MELVTFLGFVVHNVECSISQSYKQSFSWVIDIIRVCYDFSTVSMH